MIIKKALSSLYDMYGDYCGGGYFTEVDQKFLTKDRWDLHWDIYKGTFNYLGSGCNNRGQGGTQSFWKNVTLAVFDLMDYVAAYVSGEFTVENEENLEEIWEILIKNWYFDGVWIIKSEEIKNREIAMAESGAYDIPENKLFRENPFRLFKRTTSKEGNKYYFKSLLTGIDYFELDPKEMIYISLNEGANWRRWWKANMEYVAGISRVVEALKSLSKTAQVIVKNPRTFEQEEAQIENPSVFYRINRLTSGQHIGAKEQNIYQYMPLIEGSRVADMKNIVESLYDKECSRLGVTMNANEKKERLTSAENYKDLKSITNLQAHQLRSLKRLEKKLKNKGWVEEDFFIDIGGSTFAQGLPDPIVNGGSKAGFQPTEEEPLFSSQDKNKSK